MRMKFKQISVATESENGEILYALTDSGILYERKASYVKPERAENEVILKSGYYVYYWNEVDLPLGDPQVKTPVPQQPAIGHLFTDEEVEKLKAEGAISTEPIPASTPGICVHCNTPTGDESVVCKDHEFPF
jgi:hypothetical protein